MLPAWVRLTSAAALAAVAVAAFAVAQPAAGAVAAGLAALMAAAWLRYHDVLRAERAWNERQRDRAWDLLQGVPFGGRFLRRECRVYYHHARSLWLARNDRCEESFREAEAALAVPGISDEAAGCHLAAAQALVRLGREDAARTHADAARRLPHADSVRRGLARLSHVLGGGPESGGAPDDDEE